ncbi:MAG: hypothetical protein PUE58_07305 [Lachnospiraceae bacterium]|nr:hypothetical protein [Lachnospiraceae bacterium]
MKVNVRVYDKAKYDMESKEVNRIEYDIEGFEIICGGNRAKEIEAHTDGDCIDEYHEYLVLDLGNGETSTFRNSHVSMFRA